MGQFWLLFIALFRQVRWKMWQFLGWMTISLTFSSSRQMAHKNSCGAADVIKGKFNIIGGNAAGANIAFWRCKIGRPVGVPWKMLFGSSVAGSIIAETLLAPLLRTIEAIRLLISSLSLSKKSNSTIAGCVLKLLRNIVSSFSAAIVCKRREEMRGEGVECRNINSNERFHKRFCFYMKLFLFFLLHFANWWTKY